MKRFPKARRWYGRRCKTHTYTDWLKAIIEGSGYKPTRNLMRLGLDYWLTVWMPKGLS